MPRPISARIDLAALRHNYLLARKYANSDAARDTTNATAPTPGAAKAWAVVKANAYGHGLMRAAAAPVSYTHLDVYKRQRNCRVAPAPQNSVVTASETWPRRSRQSSIRQ